MRVDSGQRRFALRNRDVFGGQGRAGGESGFPSELGFFPPGGAQQGEYPDRGGILAQRAEPPLRGRRWEADAIGREVRTLLQERPLRRQAVGAPGEVEQLVSADVGGSPVQLGQCRRAAGFPRGTELVQRLEDDATQSGRDFQRKLTGAQ